MLAASSADTEAETRDAAIVTMFYCLGPSVSELCGGRPGFASRAGRRRNSCRCRRCVAGIRRYLSYRGTAPGPSFQTRGHRGKHRSGALETRFVLRIVRALGQRIGLHVWRHSLRHTSTTTAAEVGQRAGLGLTKILAHSRHRTIATLMIYVDEHDLRQTQKTLGDLVANTLTGA
jgi:integrase